MAPMLAMMRLTTTTKTTPSRFIDLIFNRDYITGTIGKPGWTDELVDEYQLRACLGLKTLKMGISRMRAIWLQKLTTNTKY